jgi:hypothetical protein
MACFIYRGELYRDDGTTMECARRIGMSGWAWTTVKGFAARKIRRVIALRKETALKTR